MNKILILATEGCDACIIAKHNLELALAQTSVDITLEFKDFHDVSKDFIIKNRIKDFPAVLYFVNDRVVNKSVGTYPSAVYLRWIDLYFKK